MRSARIRRDASLGILLLLAAGAFACREAAGTRPNVVLITIDTLRSDRLSGYGYGKPTSPVLDALADRGVLFLDTVAQATTTPPSHASILTGRNPPTHGLRRLYGQRLPDANETLAEILQARGYSTAAFVSAVPLRGSTGLDQGFDAYGDAWPVASEEDEHERSAAETNAAVFGWLDEAPTRPIFLWVHYFDPHYPYAPPAAEREAFGVADVPPAFRPMPRAPEHRMKPPRDAAVERMSDLYDAEVAYTDREIGRLLARLERDGILADAVVAVVADHGELLGEYGYYFGHWGVTDETARVPMLLAHPDGRYAGTVVPYTIATIDLVPTLLAWLGIEPGQPMDGRDLTPFLEGDAFEPRAVYTEQFEYFPVRAMRTQDWILEQRAERDQAIRTGPLRLYRRQANGFPREPVDDAGRVAALASDLDAVLEPPVKVASEKQEVPERIRAQLRALGYTGEARGPDPK